MGQRICITILRRAIAEFVPAPDAYLRKPDVIVSMSGETWAKLFLSQATPEDLIKSGDLKITGDSAEAARLINLFDRYSPEEAVVVPSAIQDHM